VDLHFIPTRIEHIFIDSGMSTPPERRRRSSLVELARKGELGVEHENMEQAVDKIRGTQQVVDMMRKALQNPAHQRSDEELDGMVAWFANVKLFQLIDDSILRTMSNNVDYLKADSGTTVVKRGASCTKLFIIISGTVKLGEEALGNVTKLTPGMTFGEEGLLQKDGGDGCDRAIAHDGSVELAVVPSQIFDQHLRSILEMDAAFMKKHFKPSSPIIDPVSLPTPRNGARTKKDLRRILRKVYHVVCFFVRWNKLMNQRELKQLWKDHWKPESALIDSLSSVCESAAVEEDREPLATESPKRICIRASGILKKAHSLRTKEEQAVLHRLVSHHWLLNLLGQSQRDVTVTPQMLSSFMTIATLNRSDIVFEKGSDCQNFYIVLSGSAVLTTESEHEKVNVGQPLGGPETISSGCKWLASCEASRATPLDLAVIDLRFFIPYFNEIYKQNLWSSANFISTLPCFQNWPRPKQVRLAYSMKSFRVREKTKVLTPADQIESPFVYFLKEGECRLMMHFQGTQIATLLKPGDIFGELTLLQETGEAVKETVITTTDSKILKLSVEEWKAKILDDSDRLCYDRIVEQANRKLDALEHRIAATQKPEQGFLPKLTRMTSENHDPTKAYNQILQTAPNEMPSYLVEDMIYQPAPARKPRPENRRGSWIRNTLPTTRPPAAFQPKSLIALRAPAHNHNH